MENPRKRYGVVLDGAKVSSVSVDTDSDNIIDTSGPKHDSNEVTYCFVTEGSVTNKTATIKVTITSTNYKDIIATITVNTKDKGQATVEISGLPETVTYGQEFTLTPTAKDGETALSGGTWTWEYDAAYFKSAGSNANTGTITLQAIKVGGSGINVNFSSATHTGGNYQPVNIQKKTLTQADLDGIPDKLTKVYDWTDKHTESMTLNFNMGGGTVWSVNGLDIPEGGVDLNLGIKTGTKNIPVKLINAITGEVSNVQLQLSHSGEFGLTLTLFLDLGKEFDGLFANLYYYNDKADALEFQSSSKISGGTASWPFDHASEYAIVIDKVNHDAARFTDVAADAYYAEAVKWALQNGVTNGISDTAFGSNDPCTRAQIVTFLWRAAGSPEPKSASSFADVPANSYYAKAVAWAVENGIATGTGNGKFGTGSDCTRAQIVTFLYRACQGK